MAHWKEHCQDCKDAGLSSEWDVVHHWLDEYAKIYRPWQGHRIHRHHAEGVEEVRKKWGDEAALAAEIHIRKDFEGYLPKDRADVEERFGVGDEYN